MAYYPFNGDVNDKSGNGNHGTISEILELFNEDNNVNCEKASYDSSAGKLYIPGVLVDGEQEYEVDLGPPYNSIDANPKN